MHVKDATHSPSLYSTIIYLLEAHPPFRIKSISPKLCLSDLEADMPISARCALQFVVGLQVDEARNLAHISFGELDQRMKLARVPLDRLVAMASVHSIDEAGVSESECVSDWSSAHQWSR